MDNETPTTEGQSSAQVRPDVELERIAKTTWLELEDCYSADEEEKVILSALKRAVRSNTSDSGNEADAGTGVSNPQHCCEDSQLLDWLETQRREWHACWGGGERYDSKTEWVNPSVEWRISHSIPNGTYDYPDELKQFSLRDAIRAARAKP